MHELEVLPRDCNCVQIEQQVWIAWASPMGDMVMLE